MKAMKGGLPTPPNTSGHIWDEGRPLMLLVVSTCTASNLQVPDLWKRWTHYIQVAFATLKDCGELVHYLREYIKEKFK